MEASLGYDPSYSWRSIWGSKAILLDGMKWRVGNGTSICVWDDAWLIGEGSHFVPTPLPNSDLSMKVIDLIDVETGCWNKEVVNTTFAEVDRKAVLDIPLSNSWPCDRRYWWPTSDGIYTVKSGYWLGRLGFLRAWELFHGTSDKYCWSVIWNLDGPPKLSHFLWRVCKGKMAVMEVLHKRHVHDSMACKICGANKETILHSIFHCKYARDIWANSDFNELLIETPATSFVDCLAWFAKQVNKDQLRVFAALAWASWHCRNLHVFKNAENINAVMVVAGFVRLSSDYCLYRVRVGGAVRGVQSPAVAHWFPPLNNVVKINVDAHLSGNDRVQLGVVIRSAQGGLLVATVKRIEANWAPDMAKAGAAKYGVELALRLSYDKVILECDASTTVRAIQQKQVGAAPIFLFYDDVIRLSGSFNFFSCNHVKRTGNTVAHTVARWDTNMYEEQICMNSFP